jgi:LacI family transcriptional regulator
MKSDRIIMIVQPLGLELGREIWHGVLDFARSKTRWQIEAVDFQQAYDNLIAGKWREMDGLIISGFAGFLEEGGYSPDFPVVHTHWLPDKTQFDQIDIDPLDTGRTAAKYLEDSGYRRFAAFGTTVALAHRQRGQAFQESLTACTDDIPFFMTKQSSDGQSFDETANQLVNWVHQGERPVGVFCTEDISAIKLIRYLRHQGLSIPDDVAVLGCEDDRMRCDASPITLSSVHLPYRQVGFEAARILEARIHNSGMKPQQIFLPAEGVTARQSTSDVATDDRQIQRAVDYIRRHACDEIRIQDVAAHAGLTPPILRRRFATCLGRSPKAEIQRVRLGRVQELLRKTELSLEEIAEATAFPSGVYLSKFFREQTGKTTRQYRRACQLRL